jgi:hypothetical protein
MIFEQLLVQISWSTYIILLHMQLQLWWILNPLYKLVNLYIYIYSWFLWLPKLHSLLRILAKDVHFFGINLFCYCLVKQPGKYFTLAVKAALNPKPGLQWLLSVANADIYLSVGVNSWKWWRGTHSFNGNSDTGWHNMMIMHGFHVLQVCRISYKVGTLLAWCYEG